MKHRAMYIIEVHRMTASRDRVIAVVPTIYRSRRYAQRVVDSLNEKYLGDRYFTCVTLNA